MKVLAVLWAYNESDFISWSIKHLLAQGIDILVFDNWSTDSTFDILKGFGDKIRAERWPMEREECSSLTSRLKCLEEISLQSEHDWIINHDVDEIRRTKTGERLFEFISRIDALGYNAIDHDVEVYAPREGWDSTQNPEEFFTMLVPQHHDETNLHIKAWKRQSADFSFATPKHGRVHSRGVNLWVTGGHQAIFPHRKVSLERLLLKHYPLRTQAHAERKLAERKRSYAPEELEQGWHRQYQTAWWRNG